MANSANQSPLRALAVIVLYKMKPVGSVSLRTLLAAISHLEKGQAGITILLYDNTPGGQDVGVLPAGVQYKANVENGGLATAYNYALDIAHEKGCDWLLTLDQDTSLPLDFLSKLTGAAMLVALMDGVAAIVPCISSDGRVLSPFTLRKHWTITRHLPDGFIGVPPESVYAINSASAIKVSALRSVGGYDPRFDLDFSDLVIYLRLHSQNLGVFVAGDIHVEHEVSSYDLKRRSTPDRYERTCRAEEAAYDEWMGWLGGAVLTARLIHRLTYQLWRNKGSFSHFKIGLTFLCRRLFLSRKRRMESWRQAVKLRQGSF
jgi:GT2 family glycosyltransferase